MEDELELKQTFLREEIIEKGYDPNMFSTILEGIKGENAFDLNNWTMDELVEQVKRFIISKTTNNQLENNEINKRNDTENNDKTSSKEELISEINKETIQCQIQEKNMLNDYPNMELTISNPELIKAGLFSFSYYQFTITSKELHSTCTRKLADFEWLRNKLIELYPGILIPPFPLSGLFDKNSNDKIVKKLRRMNKFLDSLYQNELIRSSKIFLDFITIKQDQFEQSKVIFSKMKAPKSMIDIITIDGNLNISLSEDKNIKAAETANDFLVKNELYKALTVTLKSLINEFEVLSTKFSDVSRVFQALTKAYSTTSNSKFIEESFRHLSSLTNDWSKGYQNQKLFFKEDIKEFFKYMSKELSLFDSLYTDYTSARSYYNESIIAIRDSKQKTIALKQEVISSQRYYGFLLNRFLDEYDRVNCMHSERLRKQFFQFNEKKNLLLGDYINLVNFLSFSN